jgi:hypothetical protein
MQAIQATPYEDVLQLPMIDQIAFHVACELEDKLQQLHQHNI